MMGRCGGVSGYRLMWMVVMFDLPVASAADRKCYAEFRNMLLDNGFSMSQFSVYCRFCGAREYAQKYVRLIKANAPPDGNIIILFFTDKQFAQSIQIIKRERVRISEPPEQLSLF